MDVSDIVDYNVALLNPNDLSNSFFYLSKNDPTIGFAFDASIVAGNTFPDALQHSSGKRAHSLLAPHGDQRPKVRNSGGRGALSV